MTGEGEGEGEGEGGEGTGREGTPNILLHPQFQFSRNMPARADWRCKNRPAPFPDWMG